MAKQVCKNGTHLCGGTDLRDRPPSWSRWTCAACQAELNRTLDYSLTARQRAYDAWATSAARLEGVEHG